MVANPRQLTVLGAFRAPGLFETEMQALAGQFTERIRGEWFSPHPAIEMLAERLDRSPIGRNPT